MDSSSPSTHSEPVENATAEALPSAPAEPIGLSLKLVAESDPTIGYASIQNAVPIVRALHVTNTGEHALEAVNVYVACNPGFAQGANIRFERLAPGESRRISPLALEPNHEFLANLNETQRASVSVYAVQEGSELARIDQPIEVLAYDQWAGTRSLPELLAAFCMPNDRAVDDLVADASRRLRESRPDLSMNGYQSKNREVVWNQVSAIYNALSAQGIQYSEPPASFGTDGQKIRTPSRVLGSKLGTCLDLAMIFASCLQQAGLRPVILFKKEHAWVGVWLHPTSFPNPINDDAQAIRKRIDTGEFIAFETTGIAQHHSVRPSLKAAADRGLAYLREEGEFLFAVDVHRSSEIGIKPLPSPHEHFGKAAADVAAEPAPGVEPPPVLPPLDPEVLEPTYGSDDLDTPAGRLSHWKSRLLDLTLRNKLLNFKSTKSTLRFAAPDLPALEDAIAGGKDFTIRPLPPVMQGADPRDAKAYANKGGREITDEMAERALGERELLVALEKAELDDRLLAINTAARTSLEEGGSNTLYLALGLLQWTETDDAEKALRAPILLVPVSLTRQSVKAGFRLKRHDDEAIINPTLLEKLRKDFQIKVAGLETLHADEKGLDVAKILQSFRLAIREYRKWEVVPEAHLGIFSFTKFLMWKDLEDRTDALKANRVVRHLIENPGQKFPGSDEAQVPERLDDAYSPRDLLVPLLSDASQLRAVCEVDSGRNLVLEGPPGTGKSQTITNLIAHLLAKGKKVLFVAEKITALGVVQKRLEDIGLGPFCLELHSAKASKSAVLEQMDRSLKAANRYATEEWERCAQEIGRLRADLNGLVDALHKRHGNGLAVHQAIGTCLEHSGETASPMPWADPNALDRDALDRLREISRRIASLGSSLSRLRGHPLELVGQTDWRPSWQADLLQACTEVEAAIETLKSQAGTITQITGLPVRGLSMDGYAALDRLMDQLLAAPNVPAGLARAAHDATVRARVQSLARHGTTRNQHWARLGEGWTPALSQVNATELKAQWAQAAASWWPKSVFAKKAVRKRLAAYRTDAALPPEERVVALFDPLAGVNEEDAVIRPLAAEAETLLAGSFAGTDTDWQAISRHEEWADGFAQAVNACAGFDVAAAQRLRDTLAPLVAESRANLAQGAPAGRAIVALRDAWAELRRRLDRLTELAMPVAPIAGAPDAEGALERIAGISLDWRNAARQLQPWCLWRSVRSEALASGLQGVVSRLESGAVTLSDVPGHVEYSYRSWWLGKTIDADPVLRTFSSADHERKIREFRAADERFQKLTAQYVVATLSANVPRTSAAAQEADSEMGKLLRELQKKSRHMAVRQLIQGMPTLLPRLKPCLLMSPLSVAQYLAAGHTPFDVVIFDEASQIPVWDAVGAIARGTQVVVVGDTKQLPPTSFFAKAGDEEGGSGTEDAVVADLDSILDECLGAGMNRSSLEWHYRSRSESLIAFSNARYYRSELITFPSPVTADRAVRFQHVIGVYDRGGSRTNRAEADAIVNAIEAHYTNADTARKSLGVVTFNQPQMDLINRLLDARRLKNPTLDALIAAKDPEELLIKNLENVQGDERDVIFFSITYGKDAAGNLSYNFGPLNSEGGPRRLNVAVSRAREGVVVFSTLQPSEMDLSRIRAKGVQDLKLYMEFAIKGQQAIVEAAAPTGEDPDSPFERGVIHVLSDKGWTVHPQVGCSRYRIDIGVVDPRAPGRYLAGIECDGATYHSGATARDRDRLRQAVLERLGWTIYRIWSTDWWLNPEQEIAKLTERLGALMSQPPEGDDEEGEKGNLGGGEPASPSAGMGEVPAEATAPLRPEPELQAIDDPRHPIYRPATLPVAQGDFYSMAALAQIATQMRIVIDAEGPIAESALLRAVARAWAIDRMGSRIVTRMKSAIPGDFVVTSEGAERFYWPAGSNPANWQGARIAKAGVESSRRQIYDVANEEIGALALQALEQSGSMPIASLSRIVCRMVGMLRTPADAEVRVVTAVRHLVKNGVLIEADGTVRTTRHGGRG
ncbi:MAG: hypothetical protein RJA99_988 [Pseudomonadota bacterium]|jgi:very-short-patch-repair endonuclease